MDDRDSARFFLVRLQEVSRRAPSVGVNENPTSGRIDVYAIFDCVTQKIHRVGKKTKAQRDELETLNKEHQRPF